MTIPNHALLVTTLAPAIPYVQHCDLDDEEPVDEPVDEPVCGDGELDPGELCDDGALEPGDGCDALCRFEAVEFAYVGGEERFVVPAGATSLRLEVWGAAGGTPNNNFCDPADVGGLGGYAVGDLEVTAGQVSPFGSAAPGLPATRRVTTAAAGAARRSGFARAAAARRTSAPAAAP
jgi:cysteine-rich repeat protein